MQGFIKNDDFRPISRSISETAIVRWAYAARQFVSIEFSFHPYKFSVIAPRASPGETKMWAAVRENGDFFALAVRITGTLLKIDGYMQGVLQAWQFLSVHAKFSAIG